MSSTTMAANMRVMAYRTSRKILARYIHNATSVSPALSKSEKDQMVKIGMHDINYLIVGNGPHKILLTPGLLGSIWATYRHQITTFDKEKFTMVLWDPPGFGKSYPQERVFTRQNYEDDADTASELMKFLQIPKYSLMGCSFGGTVSFILAAKYPEAVRKLVVWGAKPFVTPDNLEVYKKLRDVKAWTPRIREVYTETYGQEKLAKYWAETVDGLTSSFKSNPDICATYLRDITCPTLLLHGMKDPLINNFQLWFIKTCIKNIKTHYFPEGRHDIHAKYAEEFNERVQEFLLQSE